MVYIFKCPACGREHTKNKYEESRFCRDCGKFLSPHYKVRVQPKSVGANKLGVQVAKKRLSDKGYYSTPLFETKFQDKTRERKSKGTPRTVSLLTVYIFTNFILCSILFGIMGTILIALFAGFITLVGVQAKSGYTAHRRRKTWVRKDGTVCHARKSSWEVSPEELPPNTHKNIFALIYSICTIPLLLIRSIFTLPFLIFPLFVVYLYNKKYILH